MAKPLTDDFGQFTSGHVHDELAWKDVSVHVCRVLRSQESSSLLGNYSWRASLMRSRMMPAGRHPGRHRASAFRLTLLHELDNAWSRFSDGTLEFEDALTRRIATVARAALSVSAAVRS